MSNDSFLIAISAAGLALLIGVFLTLIIYEETIVNDCEVAGQTRVQDWVLICENGGE